jgi:hypothetical protein
MTTVALAPAAPSHRLRDRRCRRGRDMGHVDIVVLAGDHCRDAAERLAGCPHPAASPKPGFFVIPGRHHSRTMQ